MKKYDKDKSLRVKSTSSSSKVQEDKVLRKWIQSEKKAMYLKAVEFLEKIQGPPEELLAQIRSDLGHDVRDVAPEKWIKAFASVSESKAQFIGQEFDFHHLLLAVCNGMSCEEYLDHGYHGTFYEPPASFVFKIEMLQRLAPPLNSGKRRR